MKIRFRSSSSGLRKKNKYSLFSMFARIPYFLAGMSALTTIVFGSMLFSYSPYDQSLFYYSSEPEAFHNYFGALGASIAAICFFMFGSGAYCLLGCWIYITYYCVYKRSFDEEWDRIVVFVLLIPTWCGLLYGFSCGKTAYLLPGGQVGQFIFNVTFARCGECGTLVFLYGALLCELLILSRFSFIELVIWLSELTKLFFKVHCSLFKVCWLYGNKIGLFVYQGFMHLLYWANRCERAFFLLYVNKDEKKEAIEQQALLKDEELDSSRDFECVKKIIESENNNKKLFKLPPVSFFLHLEKGGKAALSSDQIASMSRTLEEKLLRFGIIGTIVDVKQGPVVTLFEYQPAIETKLSKIVAFEQDLALALQAMSVRILAPIPGTARVGFEVSNKERLSVLIGDIIRGQAFQKTKAILPLVLGKDTVGGDVVVDLADMPHLLVAGSTGSGKSIALNTMLLTLISSRTPQELSLIIVDPKRLEFSVYQHIPHLLFPIITDPHKAAPILRWLVKVMEERYQLMAELGVRNCGEYKKLCVQESMIDTLPYIVVMIDELADMMMVAGKESEASIVRLTQMARAAGIHLIVATQRPSVDVITGLIKVNFPSRISFRLTSKIDSRTILDASGAETLLGRGDMLFMDVQSSRIRRVHGAYVSNEEIKQVTDMLREQQKPQYKDLQEAIVECQQTFIDVPEDSLLPEVLIFIESIREISISLLQRRFKIGYNRSARLIELLEQRGKIMPADGSKMRKIIK